MNRYKVTCRNDMGENLVFTSPSKNRGITIMKRQVEIAMKEAEWDSVVLEDMRDLKVVQQWGN